MSTQITRQDIKKAGERISSLQERVKKIKKEGEKITERVVRTAEVSGTAFAFGVIQGKTGGVEVVGMPIDLLAGIGLSALGYLGAGGNMSDHLVNAGDGALASYATTMGRGVGATWALKATAGEAAAKLKGGGAKAVKGNDLTPEEIAMLTDRTMQR